LVLRNDTAVGTATSDTRSAPALGLRCPARALAWDSSLKLLARSDVVSLGFTNPVLDIRDEKVVIDIGLAFRYDKSPAQD
jgi:hypothetical protein